MADKPSHAAKANNLQDIFLNSLRKGKTPVTMFLVKGVKLQGIITWFDNFSVLLRRDGQSQLIYKHAISTVMPGHGLDLAAIEAQFADDSKKPTLLQDIFLTAVRRERAPVTMFLVNGVMLQGEIAAFDLFCMLLRRDGVSQLVYKHAISTVQPAHPINLMGVEDEDGEGDAGDGGGEGRARLSGFQREATDGIARGARAFVVLPDRGQAGAGRTIEARLDEAAGLAAAIGLDVVEKRALRLRQPRAATLIGSGQIEALATALRVEEATLVVIDAVVTPIQQRNLEKALDAKVIDRTGLILEIFGERAATAEGRLQVELAHLDYQSGRLVRSWTHLERQRGGFGFLGGPGETQIEADRRLIRDRMAKLRRELEQVKRTRALHRARRSRAPWPVVALVGYTNAGKSTLFNRMTGAEVMAENLLFATLDPTMREIRLPGHDKAILSDTVGFVSDLPTELVAAFRATLEEVIAADLIVHVRDMAHPDADAQGRDVEQVLTDLGARGPDAAPLIEAWNKIDALDDETRAALLAEAARRDDAIPLSALSGEGVEALRRTLAERLASGARLHSVRVPASDGAALAWLHAHGEVVDEAIDGDAMAVDVRLTEAEWARFGAR